MKYVTYRTSYFKAYFEMAKALFPDYSRTELKKDLEHAANSEKHQAIFAEEEEELLGFVNVSLRNDYVEGATSSPVGYLEALYVKPKHRNKGIARALCRKAEEWAKARGCTQMGSDTWDWNKASVDFHKKLGFKEEDTLIHFIKDIKTITKG